MSNIYKGSLEERDVSYLLGGKDIVVAYAKNQDNPGEIYYEHWININHPDTGERLCATKGYCNPKNTYECYYAEYRGENDTYHYVDLRYSENPSFKGTKSISEQQYEDRQLLEGRSQEKRESFFSEKTKDIGDRTNVHKEFFDSSAGKASDSPRHRSESVGSLENSDRSRVGVGKGESSNFVDQTSVSSNYQGR